MKTFDLTKKHKLSNDVQKNLKTISETYGDEFIIKYNDIKFNVVLLHKKFFSKNKIYVLYTKLDLNDGPNLPFKIAFVNKVTGELDNTSYIANIHKSDNTSGTNIVNFVIKLNEILGVEKLYLNDSATVKCQNKEYSLSFIKLLEKKETFYMKFGFDFEAIPTDHYVFKFDSTKELNQYLMTLIDQSRKITTFDEYFLVC